MCPENASHQQYDDFIVIKFKPPVVHNDDGGHRLPAPLSPGRGRVAVLRGVRDNPWLTTDAFASDGNNRSSGTTAF